MGKQKIQLICELLHNCFRPERMLHPFQTTTKQTKEKWNLRCMHFVSIFNFILIFTAAMTQIENKR